MKRLLNRLASIIEISYAVRPIRFDQPTRQEDVLALREMFERKTK